LSEKQSLNIKGSAKVVAEFFVYAVNSVLWQRGVYPEDNFERKNEYGTVLQVTKDPKLKDYLANVLGQVEAWAAQGSLQQLVLVIAKIDTQEPLERWVFNVETDKAALDGKEREKPREQLRGEIGAIIRQITSSVSYLPLLEDRCSFDLLVYTDKQAEVPITWENSDARMVANSQQVKVEEAQTRL
jgi:mitotic spindle assembly checkpoint protein MAD2